MNRQQFLRRFRSEIALADVGIGSGPQRRGDSDVNPDFARTGPLTPAAVLVPIVDRGPALTVLLTLRTDDLPDHAGQISFPGGRLEPGDDGPEATALRETEEEIGLDRAHVTILGRLDQYVTGTGFSITPVVGLVKPPFTLTLESREVAEAFEVPLGFLMDPGNHEYHERVIRGRDRHFHAMPYGDHFIWGATAGMLMNLYERLAEG